MAEVGVVVGAGVAMVGHVLDDQLAPGKPREKQQRHGPERPVHPGASRDDRPVHRVMGDDEQPDRQPGQHDQAGDRQKGRICRLQVPDGKDMQGDPGADHPGRQCGT